MKLALCSDLHINFRDLPRWFFDGYAIFPGSELRRELFNWWLTDVIPATWNLRFPTQIYTINGLIEFTSEHFLEL